MRCNKIYVVFCMLFCMSINAAEITSRQKMLCQRENINDIMRKVVAFQDDAYAGKIVTDWQGGTYYSGVYAFYQATGDKVFYNAAKKWCDAAGWKIAGSPYFADDICSAQTMLDIYLDDKEPYMIANIKAALEPYFTKKIINRKEAVVALWGGAETEFCGKDVWWWSDSLYMAPPVFAKMYAATGDERYLEVLHRLYWDSADNLFDKKEGLFSRDIRFINAKTPNGKKDFWGRGNGWTYAGIMRMIDLIPDNDPQKARYINLFKEMTRAIVKYQQADGLWRASLNDPAWYPKKETSSTSFFCYGLLAGINKGYLDKHSYLPVALKAWDGLLGCVSSDGCLEYAQLGDIQSHNTRPNDFVDYTHGAFLLAGSELYKMNLTEKDFAEIANPYKIREICEDGAWTWFNDERDISDGQSLLVGSLDSNGTSRIDQYSMGRTNSIYAYLEYPLSTWISKDDHNNPAILKLDNGKILTCYAKHHRDKKWYYRIGERRGNAYTWGEEKTHELDCYTTYNNLSQLSGENGRIFNFSRNVGFNPNIQYSDDNAETWQGPFEMIRSGDGKTRPYAKYADNGKDRIDIIFTDGHPRNEPQNNVYHIYYKNNAFYKSDGTFIKTLEQVKEAPMTPLDGTLIYDGSSQGRGWVWDLEYDKSGNPVAAFINSFDNAVGNDLRYRYARWDEANKKWVQQQIAFAGTRIYTPENHYAGGITLDSENLDTVYISANVDPVTGAENATGRYQIYQGKTADNGATWDWKQMTFDAQIDNLRPFVPRNHKGKNFVIWFQGEYNHYESFNTRIVGTID